MKKVRSRLRNIGARGKRKLSRDSLTAFPREIIRAFSRLPKAFKKFDVDRLLGDRISRSMKWRYLRRMEKLGLVQHSTKKRYHKVYDKVSDWMEKDVIPKVRRAEALAELEVGEVS